MERRDFLSLLAGGLVALLTGCERGGAHAAHPTRAQRPPSVTPSAPAPATLPVVPRIEAPAGPLPRIPAARPGPPHIVSHAPRPTNQIALTIDDGYCKECVDGYVAFAERSGVGLTFSPNGRFHDLWEPHALTLRGLIAAGQVQIGNHTWSHPDLRRSKDTAVRIEIERNEDWIEKTFGITARPYFRPPYGRHDHRIDEIAGGLGYTSILMWNGTLGDATLESPVELLGLADHWVRAGAIVLGHANHPTVLGLFEQLQALLAQRALEPVTLDAMFETSRAHG